MKKLVLSLFMFMLVAVAAMAQNRTISGSVMGDDGLPLPGVTVKIKGAAGGTMTATNGKYSVSVPSGGQALEFSYLGYLSQSVPIGAESVINVKLLSDSKSLSEVVVTALGIKRETKALGYAAQSVKGDDLTKADQGDVLKSLSGKIAGVQVTSSSGTPGAASYIQLRGSNSLTGNNQPLFVIDGSPVDNSQKIGRAHV